VICPFDRKAIGSIRPDYVHATAAATDKAQFVVPYTKLQEYMAQAAAQKQYPGVTFTGVMMWFNPRCTQAGWFDGDLVTSGNTKVEMAPSVYTFMLNSTFNAGSVDTGSTTDFFGPAYAYTIGFTLLGSDGNFYGYSDPGGDVDVFIFYGYNTITTTRMDLIDQNFNAIRVLGAGMKLWTNAPPINTGGYVFGGELALQDLYSALHKESNAFTATSIQDGLKHRNRYQAIDGVTVRYNPLAEQRQLALQEVYVDDIKRLVIAHELPEDNHLVGIDNYTIPNELEMQSKDLATQSTMVPVMIWQFGTNASYDLSFDSIMHVEGRTVGNCPFEVQQEIVDPNIEHLDKILRSHKFPTSAKGHSFKTFLEHAKRLSGKGARTLANATRIAKLVEEFLGKI